MSEKYKTMEDERGAEIKGRTKRLGPKRNTAAPSSLHKRLLMQLAGIEAHLKNHPHDTLSRARVAKINELLRK